MSLQECFFLFFFGEGAGGINIHYFFLQGCVAVPMHGICHCVCVFVTRLTPCDMIEYSYKTELNISVTNR